MPQGTANWSQNTIESAVPALGRYGFRRGFVREERVNSYILDTIQSEILRFRKRLSFRIRAQAKNRAGRFLSLHVASWRGTF